jgi:cytochrome oxidase Cu insertion factor (SCO1/SenC/PrrC family)
MQEIHPGTPTESAAVHRALWALLAVVILVITAAGLHSAIKSARVARVLGESSLEGLQDLGAVPAFTLTERSGRSVSSSDLRGSVWIADFIFTRCSGVCPMLTARFSRLERQLRRDGVDGVRLVSFSVDPSHDTPEVLRDYAARFKAPAAGWLFLTGDWEQMHRLIQGGFHVAMAKSDDPQVQPGELITHSDRFVLLDRDLHIRGYYHGTDEASVAQLQRDIRELLGTEAAEKKM